MLSWLWAWDETVEFMANVYTHTHEFFAWTLDHPSPEGSVHVGPEFVGSASSSQQFSDDDDITTCHGCGFFGTFAEVMEHATTCAQIPHIANADIPDPEIESEMSQAETETSQIE